MQFRQWVVNICLCQKDKHNSMQKNKKKQLKIKYLHRTVFDYFTNAAAVLKKWQRVPFADIVSLKGTNIDFKPSRVSFSLTGKAIEM